MDVVSSDVGRENQEKVVFWRPKEARFFEKRE